MANTHTGLFGHETSYGRPDIRGHMPAIDFDGVRDQRTGRIGAERVGPVCVVAWHAGPEWVWTKQKAFSIVGCMEFRNGYPPESWDVASVPCRDVVTSQGGRAVTGRIGCRPTLKFRD